MATPAGSIRASRSQEQRDALVLEFCLGNELFDKRDYIAALASYEVAATMPHVRIFALVNKGNALKAQKDFSECFSCYEEALKLALMESVEGRLLHSFILNNLGATCLEANLMDQVS